MQLADLKSMGLDELEELYASELDLDVPTGIYRGTLLNWLPVPKGQPTMVRPLIWLGFDLSPFGVDFEARRWFFLHDRSPRIGRFEPVVARSRWRDTRAVRLHYEESRLPRFVRSNLYDEVKPLSDSLCLGIGGVNADRGKGEQFFFALERID